MERTTMLRVESSARDATKARVLGGWSEMFVATAALVVLLLGFRSVVEGVDWFVSAALVVLLVSAATITLRLVGLRRTVTPIALLAELLVLAWVFVPSSLLVLLPTWDTARGLRVLIERAGPIIAEEQAPVAPSSSIVLVLAASFGVLVIVLDLVLRWRRGVQVAGVLLIAVFITPGLITGASPAVWLFLPAAALWLVLLRGRTTVTGASGPARQAPAIVLGAGGLIAALLFPVVAPDIASVASSWGKAPPQVFGRGINPIVELGTNLRRNNPITVLTYTTELADPPYLKVATLPDFTGETWRPSDEYNRGRFEGSLAVRDGIDAQRKSTKISVGQLRSTLVPVPYPTVSIRGIGGGYQQERTGLTVKTISGDVRGETYTAESIDVQPTAAQLRAANPRVTPDFKRYVELEDAPRIIGQTAREVTAGSDNNYDRAMALQSYFRSEFDYSETAPVADDYDGNGLLVIAEFLARKAGYCVHFSSAMAVMARSLDIPARVAVGYAPGDPGDVKDGRRVYTVQSDNLHAWTELYFAGVGWVRFDPTPGVGESTEFAEPTSAADDEAGAADTPESTPREDTPNPRNQDGTVAETPTDQDTSTAPRSAAAVLVAMLTIGLAPGLVRRVRRSWRLRAATSSPDPAWREVEDTARDLGVAVSYTDTPRGLALTLRDRPDLDVAALDNLLTLVEKSRYSRAGAPKTSAVVDAHAVLESLQQGAGRRARLRAAVLPRSLGPRPATGGTVVPAT